MNATKARAFALTRRPVGKTAHSSIGGKVQMKTSNLSWTTQNLDAYITDPQKLVPGNHMPYSGLPDAQERAALIAYLQSLH